MVLDAPTFNQLIKARRSVFQKDYTGQRIDDTIVHQLLENATWAPTHKLTEPWRFVVFTGDGLKKLADFQSECYKQVATSKGNFQQDRYDALKTNPMKSSHIIAVCMKRDEKKSVPEWEELGAVFCAVQNMYLTATVYGIGCYLSTGGITHFEEAKPFFNLQVEDKLLGFLHLGIPNETLRQSKRTPIAEKMKWVEM